MPSPAEVYAAAIASSMADISTTEATRPAPWAGPLGIMTASIMNDGKAEVYANGVTSIVPGAVLLAFADWVIANFRTQV